MNGRNDPPPGGAASEADRTKIIAYSDSTRAASAVPSDVCQFCGAPALAPNRRERRRDAGSALFTMLHSSWCRVYGTGVPPGYRSKSRGGAA
jgi:hypothetical protein